MLRKLFLVGLVLFAGRGSIAQLAAAICLSFFFFALQMKVWPYKAAADNVLRALTELHVFIVITTALVLKNDLVMEVVTVDAYDWVLFISFICCVPGAFILAVIYKTGEMAAAVTKAASGVGSLPPAELRRRSFQLHVVGLGSDEDKERLRRFIDGWAVAKTS